MIGLLFNSKAKLIRMRQQTLKKKKKILSGIVSKIETVSPEKPLLPESRFWHSLLSESAFCLRFSGRKTRSHRPLLCSPRVQQILDPAKLRPIDRIARVGLEISSLLSPSIQPATFRGLSATIQFENYCSAAVYCRIHNMSGKKKKKKESILIRSLISTPLLSSKKKYPCPFPLSNKITDLSFKKNFESLIPTTFFHSLIPEFLDFLNFLILGSFGKLP